MAAGMLTAWRIWDHVYYHLSRLQYVDRENGNLFRVVVKRYRGDPLITRDGVLLQQGDRYAKLHLHNCRIAHQLAEIAKENRSGGEMRWTLAVMNGIRRSLPSLARFVEEHPRSGEIKVLLGITFLHRGAERIGFDVADLPETLYARYKKWFFKFILFSCHPDGWNRLKYRGNHLIPKRVYISREQLLKQYQVGN